MSKKYQISYKISLLGESGVGKTSIITRLTRDKYKDENLSTYGGYYVQKNIEVGGIPIRLEVCDTAGQEKYRSLASNYYKGSQAIILVYDITVKDSFEELRNYWYKEVQENCSNIVLGLAANKIDLFEEGEVSEEEGKKFAEEINAVFYSTSAKESVGINELIYNILLKIIETSNMSLSFNRSQNIQKLNKKNLKTKQKNCC